MDASKLSGKINQVHSSSAIILVLNKSLTLFVTCLLTSTLTGCFDLVNKVEPANLSPSLPPPPVNSNRPPLISGNPSRNATVGSFWSFTPSTYDPDGDPVAFTIENQPTWAKFDGTTGTLSGAPQLGNVGDYTGIRIIASDGSMSSSLPAFNVSVQNVSSNSAPAITGTPPTLIAAGQEYIFMPSASDPEGDALTFDIANRPAWASFSAATGELRGTPAVSNAGTYPNIVISVSDGQLSASLPAFSISVDNPNANDAPQIFGNPAATATVGQSYLFQPTASDPDGDTLMFEITNLPAWASFDLLTGTLSGTPADGSEGAYPNIIISVSDGVLSATLPGFDINVVAADANVAPIISGVPQTTATVDQLYSFQPNASDPDGDELTFLIENQPSWATFDLATGQLSGTPVQGDEAVYNNIVISVSDGKFTAALPRFSIDVSQAAMGSVTLTWTAPTRNTDGSTLTDLIAYKIYYGTSPGNYPNEIRIDNAGVTMHVIDNLSANTYYFVSTSINSREIESDFSNVASKTIN